MDAEERERRLAETRFAADLRSQFEAVGERARQPRRRRRWVAIAVAAGVAVAGLLGTVALAGGFDPDPAHLPDPPLPAESVYPMNASGLTFGAHQPLVEEPDLMAVMATNGRVGYCYRTELMGSQQEPRTPEEAVAGNEATLRGRMIPVYESDGTTQIGVFQVGGPGSKSIGKLADGTTITQEADADGNIITTKVAPDGTTTIETKALDGTVTTKTLTPAEAARLKKKTPSPTPKPSHEPDKPRAWLLDRMSGLARDAGDARATARWELQTRYYLRRIEGGNWPTSVYAQWATVWLVIMHGDFAGGSWRYWLLDPDSHNVASQGMSDRPFDTSRIPPPQGPITLGEK